MSVHRALALARIESELGVRATYFVFLHSDFYSVFESDVAARLAGIAGMGHEIGLHFDPAFYGASMQDDRALADRMSEERTLVERLSGAPVVACSFHNPDHGRWLTLGDEIAGMVNAYGPHVREHYQYCSDSNGYWRFEPLPDVLRHSNSERLHVLTHPEWWVPEPLSPRQRIERCAHGRTASALGRYDAILESSGRRNIR